MSRELSGEKKRTLAGYMQLCKQSAVGQGEVAEMDEDADWPPPPTEQELANGSAPTDAGTGTIAETRTAMEGAKKVGRLVDWKCTYIETDYPSTAASNPWAASTAEATHG